MYAQLDWASCFLLQTAIYDSLINRWISRGTCSITCVFDSLFYHAFCVTFSNSVQYTDPGDIIVFNALSTHLKTLQERVCVFEVFVVVQKGLPQKVYHEHIRLPYWNQVGTQKLGPVLIFTCANYNNTFDINSHE